MNLLVFVVFLLVPATFVYFVWMIYSWRRREALTRQGRCLHCGYDLRASCGRCPECGNAIPPAEADDGYDESAAGPLTPIKPRPPRGDEQMQCVYRTTNVIEAELLRQSLQDAGMICFLEGDRSIIDSIAPEQRLMVWSNDVSRARDVLGELRKRKMRRTSNG
jgi:hypothetical protein